MKRMNILCKSLSTLETLGTINVLCTDKTGTLTENQMTVVNAAVFTETKTVEQAREFLLGEQTEAQAWRTLWAVAALSSRDLERESRSHLPTVMPVDATDLATFKFAQSLDQVNRLSNEWKPALNVPFTPQNRVRPSEIII